MTGAGPEGETSYAESEFFFQDKNGRADAEIGVVVRGLTGNWNKVLFRRVIPWVW
jgi:hypothetical protein